MRITDLIELAVNIAIAMGFIVGLLEVWAVRERRKLRCAHRALDRLSEGWFRCRKCGKLLSDLEVLKHNLYQPTNNRKENQ